MTAPGKRLRQIVARIVTNFRKLTRLRQRLRIRARTNVAEMKIAVSTWAKVDRRMIPPSPDVFAASSRGLTSACVWRNNHVPHSIRTKPNKFA